MTQPARRFLVPGVSTLLMLAVLLGLGTWQVYRLRWKEAILAQIAAAESAAPVPLAPGSVPPPYSKVSATGRFRFDRAAQFGAEVRDTTAGPTMGTYQVVPLQREDGAPPILVDRGWVPQTRETGLDDPPGVVTVTGYARPRDTQHWFSPVDDTATRQFFTLDPLAIGAAVGVPDLAPFTLVAMGPPAPRAVAGSPPAAGGSQAAGAASDGRAAGPATGRPGEVYPAPAQHLPRPPNNHLSYAITWYGLAAALSVISGVWFRKALRS